MIGARIHWPCTAASIMTADGVTHRGARRLPSNGASHPFHMQQTVVGPVGEAEPVASGGVGTAHVPAVIAYEPLT
jgi:hypothetical protein